MAATFIAFSVFFDGGKLIILLNGFDKKTQKTPRREIERALRLKDEYYEEKSKFNPIV